MSSRVQPLRPAPPATARRSPQQQHRRGHLAVLLLAVLLVAPVAQAGSRGQPDVVDPIGDAVDELTNEPVSGDGIDPLDIHSAWFSLRGDRLHIFLRVHDLRPHTDPNAFRTTDTVHQWLVRWELDGYRLGALMTHDALGNTHGTVVVEGDVATGTPSTDQAGDNAAYLDLDFDKDELHLDLPATFSAGLTNAGTTVTFEHTRDTVLANPWAETYASRGLFGACVFPCSRIDDTEIGANVTFGPGTQSRFVDVRPVRPVVRAAPGATTSVPLIVHAPYGALEADLRAHSDRPGWTVQDPGNVTATPEGTLVDLLVTPPDDATGLSVVTVLGGRTPVEVLVAAGTATSMPNALNAWANDQPLQVPGDLVLTKQALRTYHLAGLPKNANVLLQDGASANPVRAAYLTDAAPLATGAAQRAYYEVDEPITPLGAYTGPVLDTALTLNGTARVVLPAEWNGLEGALVHALVGRAPLPVLGVDDDPPAGAVVLASAPLAPTGDGPLTLEGSIPRTTLAAGDRIAVSLYVAADAPDGTLTTKVYSADADARLELPITDQVTPTLYPVASGTHSVALAAFGATTEATQDAFVPVAIVDGAAVHPRDHDSVAVGQRLGAPGEDQDTTFTGSLGAQAEPATHSFDVGLDRQAVTLRAVGDHAASHYDDHQLWLDLYKTTGDERRLVKSARAPGPEQTLDLHPHDLARFGRGTYEASLRFVAAGAGFDDALDYTLTLTQRGAAYLPNVATVVAHHFDPADLPLGDVTFELHDTSGDVVDTLVLYHAPGGLTLAPEASIDAPRHAAVGEAITLRAHAIDPDGAPLGFRWDLGDGTRGSGVQFTHTYQDTGTYRVTLEVHDDAGAVVTVRHMVQVEDTLDAARDAVSGTVGTYSDLYARGIAHVETYTATALAREVAGRTGGDYIDSGATQAYIQGTWPFDGAAARIVHSADDQVVIDGMPTGASVDLAPADVVLTLGPSSLSTTLPRQVDVDGVPVQLSPSGPTATTTRDGALAQVITDLRSPTGLLATAEASQLTGTLHADQRLTIEGHPDTALAATSTARLPLGADGWLAYPLENGTIQTTPAADLTAVRLGNDGHTPAWLATFDPDDATVHGIVLAGDLDRVHIDPDRPADMLEVEAHWSAQGGLGLAHYPISYNVQAPEATRYAGVAELYRMEREELGIAVLDPERPAARAWLTSAARIDFVHIDRADSLFDALWARGPSWRLEVEAEADQGGKALRAILDAEPVLRGAMRLKMDGQMLDPELVRTVTDDRTLLVTITIPQFSLHEVFVETVAPGVPPLFLWLTLALALVVLVETLLLGWLAKRRRAGAVDRAGSRPGPVTASTAGAARGAPVQRPVQQTPAETQSSRPPERAKAESAPDRKSPPRASGPSGVAIDGASRPVVSTTPRRGVAKVALAPLGPGPDGGKRR